MLNIPKSIIEKHLKDDDIKGLTIRYCCHMMDVDYQRILGGQKPYYNKNVKKRMLEMETNPTWYLEKGREIAKRHLENYKGKKT